MRLKTIMKWDIVIGLEIHVQLNTATKLFCRCKTSFGDPPNTNTCVVCQGHPGALPVLNQIAVEKAVMAGHALNCQIQPKSRFDRKNYFYPDLPKAYQISQYELPICLNGNINIIVQNKNDYYNKNINITRIHIEEDAGKLIHSQVDGVQESYIDLNRAGTPLIEIVSEPEIHSADEAVSYLQKIKNTLEYINVSDCNMEEGSLRCDANVSIKPKGSSKLGNRTEIKNMNTFKGLHNAITYEIGRQKKVLEDGGFITTETLLFDSTTKKTRVMRSKEEAHDYRYFPDADIPLLSIALSKIEKIRDTLPELPEAKKNRFISQYKIPDYDASILVQSKSLSNYYEKAATFCHNEYKKLSNWIMTEVLSVLNDQLISINDFKVQPKETGILIRKITQGEITGKIAKEIFPEMVDTGKSIEKIIEEKGIKVLSDDKELIAIIQKIINLNEGVVTKYKNGNQKVFGFFVGQVMKETKGQANPQKLNKLIHELLSK